GARSLQAKPREALKHDAGEAVPVADEVGEDADEKRLFDQPCDNVVIGAPRPEQRCQRHVYDNENRGDERHLAAEQAEAAVDVGCEDLKEAVDDPGAAHASASFVLSEETAAVFGPGGKTFSVTDRG